MQEHSVTVGKTTHKLRRAVLRARDAEPARDGGHLSAARGAARPLPLQAPGRVPEPRRAARHPRSHHRRPTARRVDPVLDQRATSSQMRTLVARRCGGAPRCRTTPSALLEATHPDRDGAPEMVERFVRFGASPRGAQACLIGAKVQALFDGRFARQRRRRAQGGPAGAAPPRHPQLRGRGRGRQHRRRPRRASSRRSPRRRSDARVRLR